MNLEAQTLVLSHELQTRVLYANLAFKASRRESLPRYAKIENMDPNAQPNVRLASDD